VTGKDDDASGVPLHVEQALTGLDTLLGTREIVSPQAMEQLGEQIGRMLRPGDLVVLTGPLGAGKTTLTRGIARGLDVRGRVQSPTFVLARTHPSLVGGTPLVHVDAYRLGSPAELDDLDIDFDRSAVIVEWGRGMVDGLRDAWWEIELDREWHGRGIDTACGTSTRVAEDLDADTPRSVTISRRP
jgi:tRNA threonylcarbamoyladenosine biosynthesis protein TsaE